jgi:putative heme-binding domain-containing protein
MKLFRSAMFLSLLCVTCLPLQVWTQTQPAPAAAAVNPGTSLDERNEGDPAYRSPEGKTPLGDASAGSRTFSTSCAGCHGSDGRGGERAHNIATARQVMALSDSDLASILRNGITGTGMPPFAHLGSKGIDDVVAYLRTLQGKVAIVKVKGDAKAGRDLFYGKAECGRCHIVKGEGGFMAPDLTDFGAGMKAEAIELAITKPDTRLEANQAVVSVLLLDGTTIEGTARAEDNFTITLQEQDGRFRTFSKQRLASIRHTGHSAMPKDYETRLSRKELDDLVSYLVAVSADAPARPTRGRRQQ